MGAGPRQQEAGQEAGAGAVRCALEVVDRSYFPTYTLRERRCATAIPFLSSQLDHTTIADR